MSGMVCLTTLSNESTASTGLYFETRAIPPTNGSVFTFQSGQYLGSDEILQNTGCVTTSSVYYLALWRSSDGTAPAQGKEADWAMGWNFEDTALPLVIYEQDPPEKTLSVSWQVVGTAGALSVTVNDYVRMSWPYIVLGVVGGALFLAGLAVLIVYLVRRRRKTK